MEAVFVHCHAKLPKCQRVPKLEITYLIGGFKFNAHDQNICFTVLVLPTYYNYKEFYKGLPVDPVFKELLRDYGKHMSQYRDTSRAPGFFFAIDCACGQTSSLAAQSFQEVSSNPNQSLG